MSKIKLLLLDAANPLEGSRRETPGRDTQFELYLAACWRPISDYCRLAPPPYPDILLSVEGLELGMEAKRVKSLLGLGKRFSKAKKQLKKTKDGGVIAMDVSTLLANSRYGITVPSLQQARADLENRLYEFMRDNLALGRKNGLSKKSFAWICYAQALYSIEGKGLASTYQWKNMNLCHENDQRWLILAKVFPKLVSVTEESFIHIGAASDSPTDS